MEIRKEVDASDLSRYRICKEIGIGEATMSRFMQGKGGLSMASLDRLSDGRFLPAVGLGAPNPVEHRAFGVARQERAALPRLLGGDEEARVRVRLQEEPEVPGLLLR